MRRHIILHLVPSIKLITQWSDYRRLDMNPCHSVKNMLSLKTFPCIHTSLIFYFLTSQKECVSTSLVRFGVMILGGFKWMDKQPYCKKHLLLLL
jgi:hypothetical protein